MSVFLNLKRTRVFQRLRNQQECHMWLLCSLRLGICKDIRLHVTQFLYDTMHELETFPDQGIRSWSNTQMKLYYAIQQNSLCFYRAPNNDSAQIVIAGIIASIMCNATLEIRIGILTQYKGESDSIMTHIYSFLEERLFMKEQCASRIATSLVSVSSGVLTLQRSSIEYDLIFLPYVMDDPVYLYKRIIPYLTMSDTRTVICGHIDTIFAKLANGPIVE